jgi:threonylcarbamoyladenosine tRNA methylthiotransferase MtaB
MKPTFFIHTTGCRANQWDSSVIAGNLERAGYTPAGVNQAELVVINACTVTEAPSGTYGVSSTAYGERIPPRRWSSPAAPQAYPDDTFGADLVLGQTEKLLPDRYDLAVGIFVSPRESLVMDEAPEDPAMTGKTRFFFKIQDGCDRFCSYCVVPYARGTPRSRSLADVLRTMETLQRKGIQEVVLTGIEISAWRDPDAGAGLTELVAILEDAPTPPRIRLSSVDPLMFDTDFIERAASSRKLARSFHIPLQSASDPVLTAMRRPYRQHDVRAILDRVFARMPDAGIGHGRDSRFPVRARPSSKRPGRSWNRALSTTFTSSPIPHGPERRRPAWTERCRDRPQRPGSRSSGRIDARKREAFHRRFTGSRARIIPEGTRRLGRYMRGYTDNYIPVHIPYDRKLENRMVEVRMDRVEGGIVLGEPIIQ